MEIYRNLYCPRVSHKVLHMERVGLKLRPLRMETGLSGRKVASAIDVPFHTYNSWEISHQKTHPASPGSTEAHVTILAIRNIVRAHLGLSRD